MSDNQNEVEEDTIDVDHSVPADLLELHVELEDAGVTPEVFKEVYGDAAGNAS